MIGLGIPCHLIAITTHISVKLTADLERRIRERTKELAELNQNKVRLLSIIAHELRNPMQGIVGLSGNAIEDISRSVTEALDIVSDHVRSKSMNIAKPMMSTILRNLVSDSLKFTPTGRTVLTSAHSTTPRM